MLVRLVATAAAPAATAAAASGGEEARRRPGRQRERCRRRVKVAVRQCAGRCRRRRFLLGSTIGFEVDGVRGAADAAVVEQEGQVCWRYDARAYLELGEERRLPVAVYGYVVGDLTQLGVERLALRYGIARDDIRRLRLIALGASRRRRRRR